MILNGFWIPVDQLSRLVQKNFRKDPVEPKALHGSALIQLAFEFVFNDFAGFCELRMGVFGFSEFLVGHGEDGEGGGASRRDVFGIVQTLPAPFRRFFENCRCDTPSTPAKPNATPREKCRPWHPHWWRLIAR